MEICHVIFILIVSLNYIGKSITGNCLKRAIERLDEHKMFFEFKNELMKYGAEIFEDFENMVNLVYLGELDLNNSKNSLNENSTIEPEKVNLPDFDISSNDNNTSLNFEGNSRLRGCFVSPNVFNLSNRHLSAAEISLLSKGLKFVPTPTFVNRAAIKEELEIFGRTLRLKWHFRNHESSSVFNPFRPKSKFNPKGKDAAIEIYLSRLEDEILAIDTKLSYSNLTRDERQALRSLKEDTSIVIKEADKGSAVVVWDREDYLQEAEKQLGDNETYEEIFGDCGSPLIRVVKQALSKINRRKDVDKQTLDYFLVDNPKIGRFYLLPKIHKRLFNVPGRPVISNSGYFTENISAFVDHHLQPLSKQVKSFIKDTNDFLQKLEGLTDLPDDFLLCTVDVIGLYPNIPHKEGLAAVKKALETREDKSISTETLLELCELVLKNNIFEHNGRIFKQKRGTAIGTKLAPPYAILFMDSLETGFLESSQLKPLVWWRYIDDIFLIWQHGEDSLKEFLECLNCYHPSIKFTANYSSESVEFLDVRVIRHEGKLITDLYVKPTDTHQYLHASSCHVYHSKRAIPYSQALRLNRICSEPQFFDKRCNQLEEWLAKRGYKDSLVREEILKARKFKRSDLLSRERADRKPPKLVLNITYHPKFAKLKSILSKIQILLTPNGEHQKVFDSVPVVGFKRGKSLKDLLVRSKLPKIDQGETPSGSCGHCHYRACKICANLPETTTFTGNNGKTYNIAGENKITCRSHNTVYLITCGTCGKQYVGSTCPEFRERYGNYKSCQKRHLYESVPQQRFHEHFSQPGHNRFSDFKFVLIDQGKDEISARKREKFWMYKLNSFIPYGLNDREVDTLDKG